jgi:hypothetical protein
VCARVQTQLLEAFGVTEQTKFKKHSSAAR